MIYTRTNFKDAVWDPLVYSNISSILTVDNVLNEAARDVVSDIDLRSTKRRVSTSPNLFEEISDYAKPSDMKRLGLIDIAPQIKRSKDDYWTLVTPEEFDRTKSKNSGIIAIVDHDGVGRIRISKQIDAEEVTIATLDSLTADGGTWEAFSADTDSLVADTDNYVEGSGSIRFNITSAGGTTAGIKNTSLDTFDWSEYVSLNRSIFVFAYITSATNITNFILELGSSASAYDKITVTSTQEGTAFRAGINILRFDFANKTTVGSPDRENGAYAALYMTKSSGKVSETGYRFDAIIAQEGSLHDIYYYSKYAWQNASGTYLENSTSDTDYLNADTDEFGLFVQRARFRKAMQERDMRLATFEKGIYDEMVRQYRLSYQSEALLLQSLR